MDFFVAENEENKLCIVTHFIVLHILHCMNGEIQNVIGFHGSIISAVRTCIYMYNLSGTILELSDRETFLGKFRDFRENFWSKFWILLYVLYIYTSPSTENREKSASLGRLFLPNHPLGLSLSMF